MNETLRSALQLLVGGVVVLALMLAPFACTMHRDHKIAEMVKSGADPTAARCALAVDTSTSPACVLAALKAVK